MTNIVRRGQLSNDRMSKLRLVHSATPLEPSSTGARSGDDAARAGDRRRPVEPWPAATERELLPLDPVVNAMLEHVRIVPPLPQIVRARVLARARAASATPHR